MVVPVVVIGWLAGWPRLIAEIARRDPQAVQQALAGAVHSLLIRWVAKRVKRRGAKRAERRREGPWGNLRGLGASAFKPFGNQLDKPGPF